MSESEAWTIGRLLEWTTGYLKQHDSTTPRLDAELLLAAARQCDRIELYTAFEERPREEVLASFRQLVRRRARGEPVAYLVGYREFYSLAFRVTPDVLIPRPETEFVVVALLDECQRLGKAPPLRIADVGTGSGVLAICAAKNVPGCIVTAIDVHRAALQVARENAERHEVLSQIEFIESDLLAAVADRQFDFVISNPPYVSAAEMHDLPKDVAEYEPRAALLAGEKGTEVIEKLVTESADCLVPGGALCCEISPMIEADVHQLLERHGGYDAPKTIRDLAGLARVVVACRSV